jgi:hypothetical protein
MEDLFYLSLMAASAPKLIYEGASHFKWEPEGRREVYDSDNEELERLYVETEEYFQQIEQREYEISQKVGSPAAPWAQIEKILSNPVEHARNRGRLQALEIKKERYEKRPSIQESRQ